MVLREEGTLHPPEAPLEARLVKRGHRVLAFELRGTGTSRPPVRSAAFVLGSGHVTGAPLLAVRARELAALLRRLEREPLGGDAPPIVVAEGAELGLAAVVAVALGARAGALVASGLPSSFAELLTSRLDVSAGEVAVFRMLEVADVKHLLALIDVPFRSDLRELEALTPSP